MSGTEKDARYRNATIASACVLCVVAMTVALAWFVGRFVPGQPQVAEDAEGPESMPIECMVDAADASAYESVEVPAGDAFVMSSVALSSDVVAAEAQSANGYLLLGGEGTMAAAKAGEPWRYDFGSVELSVAGSRIVSNETLSEWYPHYADYVSGMTNYGEYQTEFVIVDVLMRNASDEDMGAVPFPWLWGNAVMRDSDESILGATMNEVFMRELYGEPADSATTRQHDLPEGWASLAAGETRSFTFVYAVFPSMFHESIAIDNALLSSLYLQFVDPDARIKYQFLLG